MTTLLHAKCWQTIVILIMDVGKKPNLKGYIVGEFSI